ncbi:MAG TPA: calcium-binding protein [Thermoleophilaceae bacterium]
MHKRILLTLAVALVSSLALSAVAHAAAGTVKVSDGGDHSVIDYTGGADANDVTLGGSRADHTVTVAEAGIADPGPGADPGNICQLTAPDTLTCTDPKLGAKDWYAGAVASGQGGDTVTVNGTQGWLVNGEEGDDDITGSDQTDDLLSGGPGDDVIDGRGNSGRPYFPEIIGGGPGDDVLHGGPGDDSLNGEAGDDDVYGDDGNDFVGGEADVDTVHGGAGDDWVDAGVGDGELAEGGDGSDEILCEGEAGETYDGGAGLDLVACGGVIESGPDAGPDDYVIDLTAGTITRTNHAPTTATIRSIEDAETRDGNDTLIGTDGANSLSAGRGNDSIDGRGGIDHIRAYDGNDTIETADGAADRADAGGGDDSCHSDKLDELFDCEAVTLAPIPSGTSGDRTAPRLKVSRVHGSFAKGLIDLRVTSDEAARLGAEAIGRLKRAGRGALASRVGDVTLGTAAKRAAAGKRVRVVVKISKRYRRALRKGARIRVVLRATDALGNAREVSRTVRLR